jgi:hypothetical protein
MRSFLICTIHKQYYSNQIKEDEMVREYSMHEKNEKSI